MLLFVCLLYLHGNNNNQKFLKKYPNVWCLLCVYMPSETKSLLHCVAKTISNPIPVEQGTSHPHPENNRFHHVLYPNRN